MGNFEKGALSAVVYVVLAALAAMVPKFAALFYLISWFAGLFGLVAFFGGMKNNCRARAYLGGAAVLNFAMSLSTAYALWPLAICALIGAIVCIMLGMKPSKSA